MQEYILNLLPVKEAEKPEFEAIAPQAVHAYARSSTVTQEQLAAATILFGWPRPERLSKAVRLKWFQTMFAGAEAYQAEGVLPPGVWLTTSSGANSLGVAEHMLAGLLAVCQRLPLYRDNQRAHLWKAAGDMHHHRRHGAGSGGRPCGGGLRRAVPGAGSQHRGPEAPGERPGGWL